MLSDCNIFCSLARRRKKTAGSNANGAFLVYSTLEATKQQSRNGIWMGFETMTMSFYRCSALPAESSRQLGGGNYICEFVTVIISLSSSTGILPIHTSQFPVGLTAHLVEHSYHKAMGSNPLHFFQAFFMHQDFFLCALMPHWGCYRWRGWVSE